MNFTFVIVGSVVAALITHLVAAMLYMNPFVTKIYKKHKKHPAINNHSTDKKFMIDMVVLGMFIPSFIAATTYSYLKPGLHIINGDLGSMALVLAFMLIGIRIIPRFFDMNMLTSYPKKLLFIELINGIILSFVTAAVLVFMI